MMGTHIHTHTQSYQLKHSVTSAVIMTVEGAIKTLANARSLKASHEPNINQKPTTEPPNNQKMIMQIPVITKMIAQSPAAINIIAHTNLTFQFPDDFISACAKIETINPRINPPKVIGIPMGSPGTNIAH